MISDWLFLPLNITGGLKSVTVRHGSAVKRMIVKVQNQIMFWEAHGVLTAVLTACLRVRAGCHEGCCRHQPDA